LTTRIWSIALLWLLTCAAFAQQSVINEIVVQGNQRVLREVILAQMRTRVGQPYVQENLDRDRRTIEELGFFSAVDVRPVPIDGGNFRVIVNVQELPEIREFRIVGNTVISAEEIIAAMTMEVGQVFNFRARDESGRAIRDLYAAKGYYLTGITDFGPLPESPGTINVNLVETTVGTVSVQGNTRTQDWVMRRLVRTRAGEPFSIIRWGNDLRRLMNTQWFESVRSIEDTEREFGVVDLTAEVREMRTGAFNVGLQIDPRSSFAGVIRLSEANLRGTGQGVGLNFIQAARGGGGPSVDLDYTNPFFDNRDTRLRAAVYSRLMYRFGGGVFGSGNVPLDGSNTFHERRTGASVGFSRPVTDYLTYGLSGRYETVRTNNIGDTPQNSFIQQDGSVGMLTFGGELNRRDVDVEPSRGDWIRLDIEPGFSNITRVGGAIQDQGSLGNHTFIRSQVEYRRYWSPDAPRELELDAPRRVVAGRMRIGTITGTVPFFEQFFMGGADGLRGYDEDRFWGKHAFLASLEYRHPIQRSFNAIAFVDYGGAWGGYGGVNNYDQTSDMRLRLGYGVGLSFRTPLGPIRLDVGFDQSGRTRTHFIIGTSF
jgi:outer membrane protein insertion porin family